MNIVFAGTPAFSAIHLQALLDSAHSVVAVYTQPDRPAGRGKKLSISPVKQLALDAKLPLEQPLSLKAPPQQATLRSYAPDLMVVVAYGLLLPEPVLALPRHGCINVHASILPRWRGAAPIERAIEAGDRDSGITIMQMDAGLDTGDMLYKLHCPIHASDTAAQLHDRLAELGPQALLQCLQAIENQRLEPEPQNHELSTYAKKLQKQDGEIDWQLPAAVLNNKIRAFNPFPICYSHLEQQRVRLVTAETIAIEASPSPGEIIAADKSGLVVATGNGGLKITQLQLPGKKALPFCDVLNGFSHLFAPGKHFA
ncbi:MAG: methionyl-tRNA formyltransferase [Cellvibrionaceae bacterium]|nr:methionyl-tRNA formyltransferase [Cellvibrionaceae bacterium]